MPARVFHEVLGFNAPIRRAGARRRAQRVDALASTATCVRVSLAPHAPYSVSPALFTAIAEQRSRGRCRSQRSSRRVARGGGVPAPTAAGRFAALLEALGAWNPTWTPPACGPVEYLEQFGLLSDARCSPCTASSCPTRELARLAAAGATLVTCPRSNRWVGRRRAAGRARSTPPASASRSAPTAWPASTT